jgi:hypothetical protein
MGASGGGILVRYILAWKITEFILALCAILAWLPIIIVSALELSGFDTEKYVPILFSIDSTCVAVVLSFVAFVVSKERTIRQAGSDNSV